MGTEFKKTSQVRTKASSEEYDSSLGEMFQWVPIKMSGRLSVRSSGSSPPTSNMVVMPREAYDDELPHRRDEFELPEEEEEDGDEPPRRR